MEDHFRIYTSSVQEKVFSNCKWIIFIFLTAWEMPASAGISRREKNKKGATYV